jgi:hypothetical protein
MKPLIEKSAAFLLTNFDCMEIQTLKLQLVRQILETESTEVLQRMLSALNGDERSFVNDLSDDQIDEIELSRKQVQEGKVEEWKSVYQRLSK